jgi:predicted nucleotidyltransferase
MPTMATVDFGPFARARGVRLLLQFGSTLTGRVHAGSDVDLAVMLDRPPTALLEYGALAADLQALLPGREVDVAVLNHADPLLLKQVVDGCRLLYGDPTALSELRIYAFKRYQDHRRFLVMEREYVRRKVAAALR